MRKRLASDAPSPESKAASSESIHDESIYKLAEVSRVLKSATATLEKLMHQVSGNHDLTLMHCLVLVHLSRAATCKQTDLKLATGIGSTHLTKLIDELVHRDLVCRNRSSWDRRQHILALTLQGRDTAAHLLASLSEFTGRTQLDAIEQLGASLEHFVSATLSEEWFGPQDRED